MCLCAGIDVVTEISLPQQRIGPLTSISLELEFIYVIHSVLTVGFMYVIAFNLLSYYCN